MDTVQKTKFVSKRRYANHRVYNQQLNRINSLPHTHSILDIQLSYFVLLYSIFLTKDYDTPYNTNTHTHTMSKTTWEKMKEKQTTIDWVRKKEIERTKKKNSIYQFKTISIIFQFVFYVFFVDASFDCKRPFRLRTNCSKSRNATAQ